MISFIRLLAFCSFVVATQASAHPHSFIDLKNKVLLEGTLLKGFQMEWKMDEIASADLIYDVNSHANKADITQTITEEMVQTAIGNHYFSYLYDAKKVPIKFSTKPSHTEFKIQGNRVVFYITFYLSKPHELKGSAVEFYTYEPTYYMGMEYNQPSDLTTNQAQCKATFSAPQVAETLRLYAASLDKDQTPEMADQADNSLGAQFAQKVSITCE